MASAGGPDDHWAAEIRRFLDDALHSRLIDDTVYYRLVIELQHRTEERAAAVRSEPGSVRAGREELLWPELTVPPRASVSSQTLPPPPKASVPIVPNWWKEPQPAPEWRPQWAEWVGAVRALLASELASTASLTSAWCSRSSERSGSWSSPTASSTAPCDRWPRRSSRSSASSPRGSCDGSRRHTSQPGWSSLAASFFRSSRTPRSWTTSRCRRTSSERRWSRRSRWYLWRCAAATPHGRRSTGFAAPVPRCADGLAGRLGARARVRR